MTVEKIRVIQYGLGPIGIAAANLVLTKPGMEIVGAVDIAREMVGRDLGEILGRSEPLGVNVTDNAGLLFSKVKADAVIHTAGSRLKRSSGAERTSSPPRKSCFTAPPKARSWRRRFTAWPWRRASRSWEPASTPVSSWTPFP
jgi:hypothetical protein